MNGYILESRTILESEIWSKPPLYFKVWHYLLLRAQYKDYKGLKRGQLITSIAEIREACSYHVGYRKVTPSKTEIWNILEFLRNPREGYSEGDNEGNMIRTTKTTRGLLITICNFNVYQDPNFYEKNNEKTTKRTTKTVRRQQQADTTNKEREEGKEREERERGETPRTKNPYGRKKNVWLTDDEYQGIKERYRDYEKLIDHVGDYLANSKPYDDHEALINKIGREDKWIINIRSNTQELSPEEINRMRVEAFGEGWNS